MHKRCSVRRTPAPGELLAERYRLQRVLGAGGMATVYAAVDETTGDERAVKILRSSADVASTERFLREAQAASRIGGERVVKVFHVGLLEARRPYMVMERLVGRDLARRLKTDGPLDLQHAADCIVQACEALARAHAANVVHRDIKPSNLFEHAPPGAKPTLKVLDFGISKFKSREDYELTLTSSRDGALLGSPPYMSPEHVRAPRAVDHRADLWSLGVVAYRLLSGKHPFDGESCGAVFAAILERPIAPLSDAGVQVPPGVDAAIAKCLERDVRARFQSAQEVARAFAPFASTEMRELALRVGSSAGRSGATPRISVVDEEPETVTLTPPPALDAPIAKRVILRRPRRVFQNGMGLALVAVGATIAIQVLARDPEPERPIAASAHNVPTATAIAEPQAPVAAPEPPRQAAAAAHAGSVQAPPARAPRPATPLHLTPARPVAPAPAALPPTTPDIELDAPSSPPPAAPHEPPARRDLQPNPYAKR
jgi:serine/threonine-protein kinase